MAKCILGLCAFLLLSAHAIGQKQFADKFRFMGVAVSDPGYHVWGTSPVWGDDGKVHLFAARWPKQY